MESIIKWQTGEPTEEGYYLVVIHGPCVELDKLYSYDRIENEHTSKVFTWTKHFSREILAWCKLSDIEPYKEE